MWQDAFDRIICISLRDVGRDRRPHVLRQLASIGIEPDRVEFLIVDKHPDGGRKGCFESHVRALDMAFGLSNASRNVLVLEDDVKIAPTFSHRIMGQVARLMASSRTWDLLYLGHGTAWSMAPLQDIFMSEAVQSNVIRAPGAVFAHALVVSRSGYDKICGPARREVELRSGRDIAHYDSFISSVPGIQTYAVVPIQFDQRWCLGSSNEPRSGLEAFVRRFQCTLDKTDALALMSYARFHRFTLILFVVACLVVLLTCLCRVMRRSKC